MKNSDKLFAAARISEEDWRVMVDNAEHEIARLQTQITAQHETEAELQVTIEMIANLNKNWHEAKPEGRRSFASSIFEYIVYDMEIKQIVDYNLKPWAELLMQLKIALDDGKKNTLCFWWEQKGSEACLEGFKYAAGSLPSIKDAMQFILQLIYSDSQKIEKPEFKTAEKQERNAEIYRRYVAGEDSVVLGRVYGLSDRRIRNIIEKERKKWDQSDIPSND